MWSTTSSTSGRDSRRPAIAWSVLASGQLSLSGFGKSDGSASVAALSKSVSFLRPNFGPVGFFAISRRPPKRAVEDDLRAGHHMLSEDLRITGFCFVYP